MLVVRTSMIHAAAPHFLWPFAVRYATEKFSLWSHVSHSETSPTLRWTGEVGDASAFRFYHPGCRRVLPSRDVTFDESICFYRLHPHRSSPVDPPPLVEPLEVSSDTSGPAEGGDSTPAATVTPRRSARLAVPPGFPPRPSSPPLVPVAVDSGAAGGGTTGGAGSGGAVCPLGTGGTRSTGAGGPATSRQAALSPERLREWAVQWGSPGGGASRHRAGGAGTAGAGVVGTVGAGGSATGGNVVARTSGTGAPSRARSPRAGGTGGAAAVGSAAGSPGARRQASLSPERLREWVVCWGSPGGGAGCVGAAGFGGASPGGSSSGGASPGGAGAGVPGTGGTGAAGGAGGAGTAGGTTGGAVGGTGVSGASRQELLSPLQLREWAVRWGSPSGGAGGTGSEGAVATGAGGTSSRGVVATGAGGSRGATTQPQPSALRRLLSLPPAATEFPVPGSTPPLLFPPTDQSQPQLLPGSLLPAPAPHTEVTASLTARREPETRASTPERREPETRASTPDRGHRVVRPRAPAVPGTHRMALRLSSVPLRVVLPSPPASSLPHVADLESDLVRAASPTLTSHLAKFVIDPSFESAATSVLVAELVDFAALCRLEYFASLVFYSSCPPSVGGELALGCDVLEDRQFGLECLATAASHLASTLLCPEGDPDALDIPTPRTYAEAITGEYSSQWQIAMDAEMASWKSTGTYVDEVPPPGANIVDGMYVLVYVDDLVFATADTEALASVKAELQERHSCTDLGELQSYLGLQITRVRARHTITLTQSHMVQQVLQRYDFTWSSPQPIPLSTSHSLSAPPSDESVEPSGPYPELVGCLMYLMTCTRPDLAYPLSLLARYVAPSRHRKMHWDAAKRVLRYLCSTSGMGLVLGGPDSVVLTVHSDASWADDQTTHRSNCEAEIYAGAMAAQKLRWLTYLLTDLGERPRSPPVLYVDNKAMIVLCQDQRLEHRMKHIALRCFLTRELQQCGQRRLAYVATRANTADVFTKALGSSDHQGFYIALGLVPTLPHLLHLHPLTFISLPHLHPSSHTIPLRPSLPSHPQLKAVQRYTAAASQALDSLLLFLHRHSARLPATPPLPSASSPTAGVPGEGSGAWRQEAVVGVIRDAATAVAAGEAAEAEVERWRREAERGRAEGNPHEGERRRLVEMLGEARGEVEAVEGEVDVGEAQLGVMKQVDAAFGLAGVQVGWGGVGWGGGCRGAEVLVLDSNDTSRQFPGALWELDAHVARYLAALSAGALHLHLSPTRSAATATKAARGKKTKKASGAGKGGVADSSTDSDASSDSGGSEGGEGDGEGTAADGDNSGAGQVLERIDKSVRVRLASGELVPRALRQLSGGERRRVALALALAFAELAAERSGVRFDLLVLDEVFQHLDDEGVAAVAAVLRGLPQRTVVVVSQANSREALAEFGVVDWVVKRNDVATVELAHM
ncbi:unnamed protein product [Closterium sp. NIES-54]